MARSQDKCRVIAVSDAVYPCWFADILYSCDSKWWEDPDNLGVQGFRGLKLGLEPTRYSDVRVLRNTGIEGFDSQAGCIRSGSNSGAQALQVAVKVGGMSIFLVGIDLSGEKSSGDGTRDHWFGRHKPEHDRNSNAQELRRLFRVLTDDLIGRGIKIYNCSKSSTLTWLPFIDLEEPGWAGR